MKKYFKNTFKFNERSELSIPDIFFNNIFDVGKLNSHVGCDIKAYSIFSLGICL